LVEILHNAPDQAGQAQKAVDHAVAQGRRRGPLPILLPKPQADPPACQAEAEDRTPIENELEHPEDEGGGGAGLGQQRHPQQAAADPDGVAQQGHQASEQDEPKRLSPGCQEADPPESQRQRREQQAEAEREQPARPGREDRLVDRVPEVDGAESAPQQCVDEQGRAGQVSLELAKEPGRHPACFASRLSGSQIRKTALLRESPDVPPAEGYLTCSSGGLRRRKLR